jgi:hypothetical protein
MGEPFDLGVHGSQVCMRPERRQLTLQRCRGHVTPISWLLNQVQRYAQSCMNQRNILKDKWKKQTNMIHRTGNEKFAIRARNSTADPVTVWANNLDTVTRRTAP